jgi:hypothetical protein
LKVLILLSVKDVLVMAYVLNVLMLKPVMSVNHSLIRIKLVNVKHVVINATLNQRLLKNVQISLVLVSLVEFLTSLLLKDHVLMGLKVVLLVPLLI